MLGVCEDTSSYSAYWQRLVDTFNFHIYDRSMFKNGHADPRRRRGKNREVEMTSVMCAAQEGALSTLQRYKMSGMDLSASNYDGRTPLHVAAAEGHFAVVEMLLSCPNVAINCTDRYSEDVCVVCVWFCCCCCMD